ncbi:mediator complex, subunit Med4, partial [Peziza echinospora]
MNVIMEKSFDSLEAALTQLIESISSYTPSPLAASALVIADNGISESLELLAEHQANHQKIQSLRATSGALDHRLAQLLSALAQTRRQLQAVPASTLPASRDVPYDELLAYARKISKYTRPSGAQRPVPVPAAPAQQPNRPELGLTEQEAQALDSAGRAFFPWPSEELMGRGALATLNFAGE